MISIRDQSFSYSSSSAAWASSSTLRPTLCRQIPFFGNEHSTPMSMDVGTGSPLARGGGNHNANSYNHGSFNFGHLHSSSRAQTSFRAIKSLAIGHCRSSIRPANPSISHSHSHTQYDPFLMSVEHGHSTSHPISSPAGFREATNTNASNDIRTSRPWRAATTESRPPPAAQSSAAATAPFDNFAWTLRCLPSLSKSYGKRVLSLIPEEMGQRGGDLDCLF